MSAWLHEAVHLSGIGSLRPLETNRGRGDRRLAETAARLPNDPWSLTQMEPGKRESPLAAIRVIDILVDRIEGQSKLNELKVDANHVAVATRLAHVGKPAAHDRARRMRALRPHVSGDVPDDHS